MNFLGISFSVPIPETCPASPQNAPLRPGFYCLLGACCFLAFPFGLFAFEFNINPAIGSIGWTGMGVALWVFVTQAKKYERLGWYDRHEVVMPQLPYEMRESGERIVFGVDAITFSRFLMRDRTIAYSEILDVYTECKGDCLKGVTIALTRKVYCNAKTCPQSISDGGNGERSRTALAILRAQAPHAAFSGPKWVEEGWVPRLGFTHPNYGDGGG